MKKKIKVLYIHHGASNSGSARSLSFLINSLDKNKYEPYVVIFCDYDRQKKLFEEAGAKVVFVKGLGAWHGSTVSGMSLRILLSNIIHAIPTYILTRKIIKKIKPDIVHLNSTCLFICAWSIKKYNKNIPVICHVREPLLDGLFGNILRKYNEQHVDRFIAIHEYDAESIHSKKRIDVVYNFVDFNIYNPNVKSNILREELGLNNNDTICLYLARIASSNGALELLENSKDILAKRKDIHYCIVGFNRKNKYNKKVINLANQCENVHILKFRSDVQNVIASCDINIVPFTKPHSARSIIECSSMRKVSIGTNIGSIKELIKNNETGYLYEPNYKDFDVKLLKLVDDKNVRNKMQDNAYKFALVNFNSKKNIKKIIKVYDEIIKF